jgi:hypothetical protein
VATACGCLGPVLLLLGAIGFAATWAVQAFAVSANLEPIAVSTPLLLGDAAVVVVAVLLLGLWGLLSHALDG